MTTYTIEDLDKKAVGLGYKGWNDPSYVGNLVDTNNDIDLYISSNQHAIVDVGGKKVTFEYGFKGKVLFNELSKKNEENVEKDWTFISFLEHRKNESNQNHFYSTDVKRKMQEVILKRFGEDNIDKEVQVTVREREFFEYI